MAMSLSQTNFSKRLSILAVFGGSARPAAPPVEGGEPPAPAAPPRARPKPAPTGE